MVSFQDWPTAVCRGHFLVSKHITGTHALQRTNTLSGPPGRSQSGRPRGAQNLCPQSKSKRGYRRCPPRPRPLLASGLPAMSHGRGLSELLGRMRDVHLCGTEPLGVQGPRGPLSRQGKVPLCLQSGDGSRCPEPPAQRPAGRARVPSCSPCVGSTSLRALWLLGPRDEGGSPRGDGGSPRGQEAGAKPEGEERTPSSGLVLSDVQGLQWLRPPDSCLCSQVGLTGVSPLGRTLAGAHPPVPPACPGPSPAVCRWTVAPWGCGAAASGKPPS